MTVLISSCSNEPKLSCSSADVKNTFTNLLVQALQKRESAEIVDYQSGEYQLASEREMDRSSSRLICAVDVTYRVKFTEDYQKVRKQNSGGKELPAYTPSETHVFHYSISKTDAGAIYVQLVK